MLSAAARIRWSSAVLSIERRGELGSLDRRRAPFEHGVGAGGPGGSATRVPGSGADAGVVRFDELGAMGRGGR